jgi:membrane protease YdiL (CAAX protease family)
MHKLSNPPRFDMNQSSETGLRPLLVFILTTFLFSWAFWAPLAIDAIFGTETPRLPGQFFLASFGPLVGGVAASYYQGGREGLASWLSGIFRLRSTGNVLYLTCAMLAAYLIITVATTWIVTGTAGSLAHLGETDKLPGISPVAVWVIWMLTFGMGEESGWRGWLYAFLVKKFTPVQAAAWVTIVWMLWHLPAFAFNENYQEMGWGVIGWAISLFYGSVLLGWLFQKSGSVIPLIAWHGGFDLITASDHLPDAVPMIISGVVILQGIYLSRKSAVT